MLKYDSMIEIPELYKSLESHVEDGWRVNLEKEIIEEKDLIDHHTSTSKTTNNPQLYEEKGGKSTPQRFVLIIFSLAMNCVTYNPSKAL